jgi:hypothetical protein
MWHFDLGALPRGVSAHNCLLLNPFAPGKNLSTYGDFVQSSEQPPPFGGRHA